MRPFRVKPSFFVSFALFSIMSSQYANAAPSVSLKKLQSEIQQMRAVYEARIQSLEKRLAQAEQKQQRAEKTSPTLPVTPIDVDQESIKSASAEGTPPIIQKTNNQFNPAISLILSGIMGKTKSNNGQLYQMNGFMPIDTSGHSAVAPTARGLNLSESELTIGANIDPYFYGQMTVAQAPEGGSEVEEAFIKTTALDNGFSLKAGRFYSGIGYLNEHHKHVWDFVDSPLAYNAFLGGQLKAEGLQFKWIAPTPFLLELGLEASGGRNFPASNRDKNGSGAGALFARIGGDLNESHNWRAGLAYFSTTVNHRSFNDMNSDQSEIISDLTGKSRFWNAHFVWKWAPNGNPIDQNFKFQAEYFKRVEEGLITYDSDNFTGNQSVGDYYAKQSGWYMQGVYQFMPRWRIGLRTEKLNYGTVSLANAESFQNLTTRFNPQRTSMMFDYSPTEYSRLRLQWTRDESMLGLKDNQIFLQYIMSLGSHGAHAF